MYGYSVAWTNILKSIHADESYGNLAEVKWNLNGRSI